VRVVHHYGSRPEFVLIGGLVPQLLCSNSSIPHAGTTDIDVQVDLEIAGGAVNTATLEQALRNAEFKPDTERVWRWSTATNGVATVVKFELLADLDNEPTEAIVAFDNCEHLGAINLRGTGVAARDTEPLTLRAVDGGVQRQVEILVTGLAGFLMAKVAAAKARRKAKDWYDIAYVLIHNDAGGPEAAAAKVIDGFSSELGGALRTPMLDLVANFAEPSTQGAEAYVSQTSIDHPDLDPATAAADAVLAVGAFHAALEAYLG
jgi:hypothetical protein